MVKYIGSFMIQRIINNKHYNDSSLITRDKFESEGEIVISNEYGFEGIYIINTNGDVVKIGYKGSNSGSGSTSGSTESGGTPEYVDGEFVRNYLKAQAYMTSAKTAEMLSVLEDAIAILSGDYTTHKVQNETDFNFLNAKIDALSGLTPSGDGEIDPMILADLSAKIDVLSGITSRHIEENVSDFQAVNDRIDNIVIPSSGGGEFDYAALNELSGATVDGFQSIEDRINALSGLTAEILSEDDIRNIVTSEISFLVSSADSMFNVLREIAEWVESDATGSAALISDVGQLKENVSGLTERVESVEDEVDAIEDEIVGINETINQNADTLESAITVVTEYIESNDAEIETINERIDGIVVPDDEHIRDIAAQEVSSLVSSADSMYQVLQELAEWVENDTTGSAQLISDVGELKDAVSANTRDISTVSGQVKNALDIIDAQQNNIEDLYVRIENIPSGQTPADETKLLEVSAKTVANEEKINVLSSTTAAIQELVENLPTPSGSSIDEETLNALKAYIDAQIASISKNDDHVFLSRGQYNELMVNGQVEIDGEMHYYSDDVYYCIYEGVTPTPSGETSGSSYEYDEETGFINLSGNTPIDDGIVEIAASVDEDGYVTITEPEIVPEEGGEPDEDSNLDISGLTDGEVDEDGYVDLQMPDNWEII